MDTDLLSQIIQMADTFIALIIAVWIIQIGIKRMDVVQEQYRVFVQTVMQQQQQNNDELMKLLSALCIPPRD